MSTHHTRRRAAALPVLLLGLLASVFVGAGTAHAENVSLTVSKGTDLDPIGETVTVTGSGFKPGIKLFVTICDPAQPAGRACDVANFKMVDTDSAGGFVTDYKPVAKFGTTDCLTKPCAIQTSWVGNGKDRTQEGTVAVGFKGGVAPTLPSRPQENEGPPGGTAPTTAPGGAPSSAASAAPGAPQTAASAPTDGANTPAASDKKDDGSDSTVWIVVGVVAAVVVLGGGAFVLVRRRSAG